MAHTTSDVSLLDDVSLHTAGRFGSLSALRWQGFALALPIALLTLVPLLAVMGMALTPHADVWQHLWQYVLPRVLANTLVLMLLVGVSVVVVGLPLAWVTVMCDFPGRRFFSWALVLPLAMPAYVLAFVQMGIFEFTGPVQTLLRALTGSSRWFPQIRGSLWGLVLVLTLALYPYVYLLARSAFLTQGRRCMEAAQALGHSPAAAFWRVALPLARPWVGAGVALVLMEVLADFGAIAVFNYDTFTTALYKAWFDLDSVGAAAQLASLLMLTVLVLVAAEQHARSAQRFSIGISVHTQRSVLHGVQKWAAFGGCALVFAAAFALPVAQMLTWVISSWQGLPSAYWRNIWNTLYLALCTAAITTTLALLLAWVRRRHSDALTIWIIRLAVLGYALPGVVLAVGVFVPIAWLDAWLASLLASLLGTEIAEQGMIKGSLAAMLLALAARFIAVTYNATDSAMQRITRSQEDACASLGLTPWQTLRRLHLPLLRTGLLSGFLLVAVDVMKEMPITLMTRQIGWDTLSVQIFQLTTESMWDKAALPALTIVAVGLLPVSILVRQTEKRPTQIRASAPKQGR